MKLLLVFFLALLVIGGGLKMLGAQLPVLDYPIGGPMAPPEVEIREPDLNLP